MFFSPPFSCSASLCEQLLAGGSGETPAYTLLEYCRIYTSFYLYGALSGSSMIGILPYYYFLLLGHQSCLIASDWIGRLPYLYFLLPLQRATLRSADWKTAVLLLPSTGVTFIFTNARLEYCRIYTSFYSEVVTPELPQIGRLPYLYFLLLLSYSADGLKDWKTAVFILPSTS